MNECNDIPTMSVSQFSSLQCAPIPMTVIDMCYLVNKSPQPCNTIRRSHFMSSSPSSHICCFITSFPFSTFHTSASVAHQHTDGLWHSYQVYLQVHWPEGQAHEVPQLHEHPGPMRKRKSQLGIAGKREAAGHVRGWGFDAYPL